MSSEASYYMIAMRTVIWERNRRRVGSAAAERIRARMRPTMLTRITDWLFGRFETVATWTDGVDEKYSYGKAATVFFFAVMFVGFLFMGRPERGFQFFGTLACLAMGSRAYFEWHRTHPLPPVHLRKIRHEAGAISQAIVGGLVLTGAHLMIKLSLDTPGPLDVFQIVLTSGAAVVGIFIFRTEDRPPEKGSGQLLGLLGLALMGLAMWGVFELMS